MKGKILVLADNIFLAKRKILNKLINFIADFNVLNSIDDRLRLVINLYLIITSNIETLDAKFVKV